VTGQRTYWHLAQLGRKPTEYDIASSRLLYHHQRGFAVQTPVAEWHAQSHRAPGLQCDDWDAFDDPRATTYSKYVALQRDKEVFTDGLLASIDASDYDQRLAPAWLAVLERVIGPLRYPAHGLQMAAAYLGAVAPAGKLVIASAFQAGDEIRRVQRLAYRLGQLRARAPQFGTDSRAEWEHMPAWQPLRELIERLLVTYDWSEALIALNAVVKPAFDQLFMVQFAEFARTQGDECLQKLFWSLYEDCLWQRQWTRALFELALRRHPDNRRVLDAAVARWAPCTRVATEAAALLFALPSGYGACSASGIAAAVDADLQAYWITLGLAPGAGAAMEAP
jgi:hypothetical protein